jgi:hypothetical protein
MEATHTSYFPSSCDAKTVIALFTTSILLNTETVWPIITFVGNLALIAGKHALIILIFYDGKFDLGYSYHLQLTWCVPYPQDICLLCSATFYSGYFLCSSYLRKRNQFLFREQSHVGVIKSQIVIIVEQTAVAASTRILTSNEKKTNQRIST